MADTPDILQKILARKEKEITERKSRLSLEEIRRLAINAPAQRGFYHTIMKTIDKGKAAVIAEIKKASPSQGVIREDFNPAQIAESYANAGASCLSILTDVDFFQGKDEYLKQAKDACMLPVLRKDFMIDPYQILEARVHGADCVLLILSLLSEAQCRELAAVAREYKLDVLAEVHTRSELEKALDLGFQLIGINNRDLTTFSVSLSTTEKLIASIPNDVTLVSESGIKTREDVERLGKIGVDAVLVGETLMRQPDVGAALRKIAGVRKWSR